MQRLLPTWTSAHVQVVLLRPFCTSRLHLQTRWSSHDGRTRPLVLLDSLLETIYGLTVVHASVSSGLRSELLLRTRELGASALLPSFAHQMTHALALLREVIVSRYIREL